MMKWIAIKSGSKYRKTKSQMCDGKVFQFLYMVLPQEEGLNQQRGNSLRFNQTKPVIGHFLYNTALQHN